MAQIRKFDGGGTFSFNGKTYNYDDYAKFFEEQAINGNHNAAIIVSAKSKDPSKHISISSRDNTFQLSGIDESVFLENGMSQGTYNSVDNKNSFLRQLVRRKSGNDWIRDGLELGRAFQYSTPIPKEKPEEETKYKYTFGGNRKSFRYSDDGNLIDDPDNYAIWDDANLLEQYYLATPEERKFYDISALDEDKLNAYIKWRDAKHKELGDQYDANYGLSKWKEASKTKGGLGKNFYNIYDFLGYNLYDSQEDAQLAVLAGAKSKADDLYNKTLLDAGYNPNIFKDYLTLDDKGNIVFTDKARNALLQLQQHYKTNNFIFNDEFHSYHPGFEWLKGYVLFNGKLYKESDIDTEGSRLYDEIRKPGGFYDLNKAGNWEESDKLFKWNYSGKNQITRHETPYVGLSDFTNQFDLTDYSTGNTYYTNPEGIRNNIREMGWKIIRYIAKNAEVNNLGHPDASYAIVDQYGRPVQVDLTKESFEGGLWAPNNDERNDHLFTPLTYAFDQSNEDWKGWFEDTELSANKPNGENLFKVYTYFDNDGKQKYRLVINDERFRGKHMQGYAYEDVPLIVIQTLAKALAKTDQNNDLQRLANAINDLTNTGWNDLFTRSVLDKKDSKAREIFKNLGLSEQELDAFRAYFGGERQSSSTGSQWERRNKYAVPIPIHRTGGILKFQAGGYNAGSSEKIETPVIGDIKDLNYFEDSATVKSEQLTPADWTELTSVGLDVLGTAASFIPGYGDAVGLGLGVASSATQLGADLSRPGNTGRDWGNFAKNLGLDVVTAIPFLGDVAGIGSTLKKLTKVSKYLGPLFIGVGLHQAAGALQKVGRGEELTVDDWASLASGFQAIMGIGAGVKGRIDKSKVAALTSKKLAGKTPSYKYTVPGTDKTVELTSTEVERLLTKKPKEATAELNTIVKNRLKDVEGIEIPQVKLEDFGLTSKGHLRWQSVEGKPSEQERSALSFFLTGKPGKYLDQHASDIPDAIADLAKERTTTKKVGPSIETTTERYYPSTGTTRMAARVLHNNNINVPTELYGWGLRTRRRMAPVSVKTKYAADLDGMRQGTPLMLGYTPQPVTPVQPAKRSVVTVRPTVEEVMSRPLIPPINLRSQRKINFLTGNRSGTIRYTPEVKTDTRISRLGWNAVSPKEITAQLARSKDSKEFWKLFNSLSPTRQKAVRNYIEKSSSTRYKQMFDTFFDKKNIKAEISKIQTAEDFYKFVKDAQNRPELINFLLKNPKFFQQYMKAAMNRAGLKGSKVKSYRDYFKELGVTLFDKGGKLKTNSNFTINTDEKGMSVASWFDEEGNLKMQRVDDEGYALNTDGERVGNKPLENELFDEIEPAVVIADTPEIEQEVIEAEPASIFLPIEPTVSTHALNVQPTDIKDIAISPIPIKTNTIEKKQLKFKDDPFRFVKRRAAIIRGKDDNVQPMYTIALKNGGVLKAAGGTVLPWGQIGQAAGAIVPEAAKIGMAVHASKQQWEDAKKMRKELSKFGPQGVTEIYDNFSDYGVANAYRQYANSYLNNQATSNDYLKNYAANQTNLNAYNTAGLESNLKLSEMKSNYAGEQNALRRNYAAERNNTLNAWNQYQGNLLAAEYQYKGAHRAQVNQALQGGIKNIQDILGGMNAQRSTASGKLFQMDQAIASAAKAGQDTSAMQDQRDYFAKQYYLNAKKGGKLSRQRSAADQIWINKERDVQKAVSKLNDNAVKFILKALS